jgi:hypothetical protein
MKNLLFALSVVRVLFSGGNGFVNYNDLPSGANGPTIPTYFNFDGTKN